MFRLIAISGRLVALSMSAGLILTGCAASEPKASSPSAETVVDSDAWPVVTLSGKGSLEHQVDVPAGAYSMLVTFACTSGIFSLSTNSDMNRSGSCGGLRSFHLPLPEYAKMNLTVGVPDDTAFSLTAVFRTDAFTPDSGIASDCTHLSSNYSAILNAEEGFAHDDVSTAEWTSIVDQAASDLTNLTATSSGLIGQQLPAVLTEIAGPNAVPGKLLAHEPLNDSDAARDIIGQACAGNGTPLAVTADYGG